MILVWLRMAASADPPSGPISLSSRLHRRVQAQCMLRSADTKANAFQDEVAAHFSEVMAEPLIPSHSLVMPSAV